MRATWSYAGVVASRPTLAKSLRDGMAQAGYMVSIEREAKDLGQGRTSARRRGVQVQRLRVQRQHLGDPLSALVVLLALLLEQQPPLLLLLLLELPHPPLELQRPLQPQPLVVLEPQHLRQHQLLLPLVALEDLVQLLLLLQLQQHPR